MGYWLYVLHSKTKEKYYIGQTGDLEDRIRRHNGGRSKYTKDGKPWELMYSEEYATRSEAVRRELYLKSPSGWKELEKIKHKYLRDVAQPG